MPDPRGNAPEGAVFEAKSLLSGEGIRWMSTSLVTNFVEFVPLGTVLVALLGVGVAERSGLAVRGNPRHGARRAAEARDGRGRLRGRGEQHRGEMGYVVLIPLAMAIFPRARAAPARGMAAAFAGVSGGYSANLLIGTVDPLLAGITRGLARLIEPAYTVHPA